jgi:thiosulfate dehydrogenase
MPGLTAPVALTALIALTAPVALGALVALAACGIARGETTAPASAAVCQGCHGVHGEGNAAAAIPRLAGQSAEYLGKQLEDYASGDRANPVMQNFAKPLSHADIEALSAYFSTAGAPSTVIPSTASAAQLDLGRRLARQGSEAKRVQACNSCHGPDGVGVLHAAPYLAGQSAQYLTSALTSFQQRTRKDDPGMLMTSVAGRLSESDIAAAAAYFSSLPSGTP